MCLANAPVTAYFNPEQTTEISVDASPVGLGAILAQVDPTTKVRRTIAYASRSLITTEQRIRRTERGSPRRTMGGVSASPLPSTVKPVQHLRRSQTPCYFYMAMQPRNHLLVPNYNRTKQPCITAEWKRNPAGLICLGTFHRCRTL